MELPKILIHPGNGDASLLIDGYKMPPGAVISGDYNVTTSKSGWLQVNLTLFASEITVIDGKRTATYTATYDGAVDLPTNPEHTQETS